MIYFETEKNYTTLKDLLDDFLFPESKTTYSDKEYTIPQCKPNALRSISDLLDLSKTYLPETTLEDLLQYIYNLRKERVTPAEITYWEGGTKLYPSMLLCPNVGKVVLANWPILGLANIRPLFNTYDYFNPTGDSQDIFNKEGIDGYSLKQLKEILNENLQAEDKIP